MQGNLTSSENIKLLIGFILFLVLGYYARPFDYLSLLCGAILILIIARSFWLTKMEAEVNNTIALIIAEGRELHLEAYLKHRVSNPDLYSEIGLRNSIDNELYDYGNENEEYLVVDNNKVPNNDVEIIQYGIYSKVHDIWIAVGCYTSGGTGPSEKDSYWLCDEDFTIIRQVFPEVRNNINIKKFINLSVLNYGRVNKDYLVTFKKSAKRENYY